MSSTPSSARFPEFTINVTVIGPTSSGKSTFVNALTGQPCADTALLRTTMVPNVYIESESPDDAATMLQRNVAANAAYLAKLRASDDGTAPPMVAIGHAIAGIGNPLVYPVSLSVTDVPGLDDCETAAACREYLATIGPKTHVFVLVLDLMRDHGGEDAHLVLHTAQDGTMTYRGGKIV